MTLFLPVMAGSGALAVEFCRRNERFGSALNSLQVGTYSQDQGEVSGERMAKRQCQGKEDVS